MLWTPGTSSIARECLAGPPRCKSPLRDGGVVESRAKALGGDRDSLLLVERERLALPAGGLVRRVVLRAQDGSQADERVGSIPEEVGRLGQPHGGSRERLGLLDVAERRERLRSCAPPEDLRKQVAGRRPALGHVGQLERLSAPALGDDSVGEEGCDEREVVALLAQPLQDLVAPAEVALCRFRVVCEQLDATEEGALRKAEGEPDVLEDRPALGDQAASLFEATFH